ncbi:hypothetical protein OG897_37410 [Streptomyces sp. NBC_00237]|nr:hypothetical protein [Streptomyces sp. NBC_00237]MCX5207070.1 hypothetical protein [Streptomyces sp. NBC_00237]
MSLRAILLAAVVTGILLGIANSPAEDSSSSRQAGSVAEAGR